jgi:hypothetical protein
MRQIPLRCIVPRSSPLFSRSPRTTLSIGSAPHICRSPVIDPRATTPSRRAKSGRLGTLWRHDDARLSGRHSAGLVFSFIPYTVRGITLSLQSHGGGRLSCADEVHLSLGGQLGHISAALPGFSIAAPTQATLHAGCKYDSTCCVPYAI